MAYTTVNKSSDHFNTKLYTGNATDNTAITGVGFTPSFLWGKNMTDNGTNHYVIDAVRGVTKEINPNNNSVEATDATLIKSFDSDGFTLGDGSLNQSSKEFVSWNWKANGTGSANTAGSINSTVSANTTSGFSIVKWTGTGGAATVGHGLGIAPEIVFVKGLGTTGWYTYAKHAIGDNGAVGRLVVGFLENSAAFTNDTTSWQSTDPSSTLLYLNAGGNQSMENMAYCFSSITGFSKMGSYKGNGNADGSFIYTGFVPAFVMIKRTNSSENWFMFDNKRSPFNIRSKYLVADGEGNNSNADFCDFLSNGFKIKVSNASFNQSGSTYIFMAFAKAPLVGSNNVPATAR